MYAVPEIPKSVVRINRLRFYDPNTFFDQLRLRNYTFNTFFFPIHEAAFRLSAHIAFNDQLNGGKKLEIFTKYCRRIYPSM